MSESRLETVLALVVKLAGMVDDKPALAEDLATLVGRYECMFCSELARDTVSLCAECEAADKCEECKDPCVEGFSDKENNLCERCHEFGGSREREAARREFDRREAALDDEYSRRKDERGPAMLRAMFPLSVRR